MKLFMIYDIKDNECCIAQYDNYKELALHFNRTYESIRCAVSRHNVLNNKYIVEKVEI